MRLNKTGIYICDGCKKDLPLSLFPKGRRKCRPCVKIRVDAWFKTNKKEQRIKQKAYNEAHKEGKAAKDKLYREANKEKLAAQSKAYREIPAVRAAARVKKKAYREANREALAAKWYAYKKERMKTDPLFKLRNTMAKLVYGSLTRLGHTKKTRTCKILGCTFEELQSHIEKQFTEGMSWENHGEWQTDHIIPYSLGETEEEVVSLNHYSNLQPLWKEDNLKKSDKLILDMISPKNKIRYKTIISRHV